MPKKIATRRSAIHGNGMFAIQPISKGERLIEYKGRRRTHEEVDAGDSGDVESGHTFLFTLNEVFVIDAMGQIGRALPGTMRETGLGGLAATPTGKALAESTGM